MVHANAALTPRARLRTARLIAEEHCSSSVAAKTFMCSEPNARKWTKRFREEGPAGMQDRSSRPRHIPTRTPSSVVRQIVSHRWRHRLGPVQIGGRVDTYLSDVNVVAVVVLATAYMEYCLTLRGVDCRPSLLPRSLAQARFL